MLRKISIFSLSFLIFINSTFPVLAAENLTVQIQPAPAETQEVIITPIDTPLAIDTQIISPLLSTDPLPQDSCPVNFLGIEGF